MKKTLITAILFLFIGLPLFSQNRNTQLTVDTFTGYVDTFNTREIYDINNPDNYIGTPYYNNTYLSGNVYLNNELLLNNVALRYNVFSDEIEYKESLSDDHNSAKAIVKSKDIYVTINNQIIVFVPNNGYFLVIKDGNNFSLIKKVTKKYYPPRKAANTYDKGSLPTFTEKFVYYISTKEGKLYELPKSKSKKLKAFGNSEKLVKDYIKEYDLDLNKEKDLKKVIMHLDGIEGATL